MLTHTYNREFVEQWKNWKNNTFPVFILKIITVIQRRASRKHIRLCVLKFPKHCLQTSVFKNRTVDSAFRQSVLWITLLLKNIKIHRRKNKSKREKENIEFITSRTNLTVKLIPRSRKKHVEKISSIYIIIKIQIIYDIRATFVFCSILFSYNFRSCEKKCTCCLCLHVNSVRCKFNFSRECLLNIIKTQSQCRGGIAELQDSH